MLKMLVGHQSQSNFDKAQKLMREAHIFNGDALSPCHSSVKGLYGISPHPKHWLGEVLFFLKEKSSFKGKIRTSDLQVDSPSVRPHRQLPLVKNDKFNKRVTMQLYPVIISSSS